MTYPLVAIFLFLLPRLASVPNLGSSWAAVGAVFAMLAKSLDSRALSSGALGLVVASLPVSGVVLRGHFFQ